MFQCIAVQLEPNCAGARLFYWAFGLILAFFRTRLTTEAQRAQSKISFDPMGDGDWLTNTEEAFLFGGYLPAK